jgi:hypothetical protein
MASRGKLLNTCLQGTSEERGATSLGLVGEKRLFDRLLAPQIKASELCFSGLSVLRALFLRSGVFEGSFCWVLRALSDQAVIAAYPLSTFCMNEILESSHWGNEVPRGALKTV